MRQFFWAVRYVTARPATQIVKIVSLTLGLAVGLVLMAKVAFERSENNFFPDKQRVYQVTAVYPANEGSASAVDEGPLLTPPVAAYLADNIPAVESATKTMNSMVWRGGEFFYDENFHTLRAIFADEHLFEVLDYGMVKGDAKQALAGSDAILLAESAAERIFGEADPIGQTVLFNKITPLTVRGVFRDVSRNASVWFEAIMPMNSTGRITGYTVSQDNWDGNDSFYTYMKLREGAKIEDVEPLIQPLFEASPLKGWIDMFSMRLGVHRIDKTYEWRDDGNIQYLLVGLAFLVLFIAAMNYVLVAIGALEKRVKAIAMQKCNGASSSGIFGEFLIETALLILISLGLAVGLLWAFGSQIESQTGESVATLFAPQQWARLGVVVVGFFLVAGVIPGRIFSRIPVAHAFKRLKAGKQWWKQSLMFVQLLCATVVLVFLIIAVRQYRLVSNRDMGYEWKNIAAVDVTNINRTRWEALESRLEALPYVEGVAYAGHEIPVGMSGQTVTIPGTEDVISSRIMRIQPGFLELMGIGLAAGQDFNQSPSENRKVIINRRLARMLGWDATTAVGQVLNGQAEVVGVTEDFMNVGWAGDRIQPIMLSQMALPEEEIWSNHISLHVKLGELTVQNMEALRKELEKLLPDQTVEPATYEELILNTSESVRRIKNLVMSTAVIICLITLAGLVGYVNDEVRRRRREIAIRKINGATAGQVIGMVARSLVVVAGVALGIGMAGAWFAGRSFLMNFPTRVTMGMGSFVAGAAAVVLVVAATIVARSWSAANENPSITIKTE